MKTFEISKYIISFKPSQKKVSSAYELFMKLVPKSKAKQKVDYVNIIDEVVYGVKK